MIGGLVTSTLFTLLALPTFYQWVEQARERILTRRGARSVAGRDALKGDSPLPYPSAFTFFFRSVTPTPTSTSAEPRSLADVKGSDMNSVPTVTAITGVA